MGLHMSVELTDYICFEITLLAFQAGRFVFASFMNGKIEAVSWDNIFKV